MYHLILSIAVYPAHPLTRLGRLNWTYCFSKTKLRCQNLYFELDNKQDAMRKLFIYSKLNKFALFLCFLGRLNWTYCFSKTKLRCQNLYFELDNKQDAMRKLFIYSKLNKFAPFLCFLVVCGSSRRQGELMLEKGVKYKLKGVDQALIRQEAVI